MAENYAGRRTYPFFPFCHFCLIVYFDPIDCRTDSRRESAFLRSGAEGRSSVSVNLGWMRPMKQKLHVFDFLGLHQPRPEGGRMHSIGRCFLLSISIGTRAPEVWRCEKMVVGKLKPVQTGRSTMGQT